MLLTYTKLCKVVCNGSLSKNARSTLYIFYTQLLCNIFILYNIKLSVGIYIGRYVQAYCTLAYYYNNFMKQLRLGEKVIFCGKRAASTEKNNNYNKNNPSSRFILNIISKYIITCYVIYLVKYRYTVTIFIRRYPDRCVRLCYIHRHILYLYTKISQHTVVNIQTSR